MTTSVRDFKNRRSAVDLLRGLGIAPYHYDDLIQVTGDRFQVTLRDGAPVSKIALLAETLKTGEALTRIEEPPAVAAQRVKQVAALGKRYGRTEAAAQRAENEARAEKRPKRKARKPKRPKPRKTRPKKLRGVRQPRPPVLDAATVAKAAKAVKATSVGAACLELYLTGRPTAEVWLIVRFKFDLGPDKATYPSWYLCHYRRRGLLPTPKET